MKKYMYAIKSIHSFPTSFEPPDTLLHFNMLMIFRSTKPQTIKPKPYAPSEKVFDILSNVSVSTIYCVGYLHVKFGAVCP